MVCLSYCMLITAHALPVDNLQFAAFGALKFCMNLFPHKKKCKIQALKLSGLS